MHNQLSLILQRYYFESNSQHKLLREAKKQVVADIAKILF